MTDTDFTLGPSASFGMNVSTTQHPVGQFEPDPRDTRIAELEAALKQIEAGHFLRCPFDDRKYDGHKTPCRVCGDLDPAHWTDVGEIPPPYDPGACHTYNVSSIARAALRGEGK